MNGNNGWINLKEASVHSGLSKRVLRKRIKEGKLLGVKETSGFLTKKAHIDAMLQGIPAGEQGKASPGQSEETTKFKEKYDKIKREAELADQEAKKAEAISKKVKAEQETAAINAGMTVAQLQEWEREIDEAMLEMDSLMGNMVKIKEAQGLVFGDKFKAEWDKLAGLVDRLLGRGDTGEEAE